MAGGPLAWARALPTLGAVEVRNCVEGRELQPNPGNTRASENTGAGTWMNEL